jgi:alpha-1,3-rhamnosyl/mannosyltransferase
MHVVVNRLLTAGSKSGIGTYVAELYRCLRDQAGTDQVSPFPQGWLWRLHVLGARLRSLLETGRQPAESTTFSWRTRLLGRLRDCNRHWLESSFRTLAARHGFDLYHEPNYIPLPVDLPTVATIHDLSILLHPEWHPADRVRHFQRRFRQGLNQCRHLLTVSDFARQEIVRTLGVHPDQVTCTYNGVRPGLRPLPPQIVKRRQARLGLPPGYLLCLGNLEPRKNVLMLLQVYCSLPAALRQRWPLVLVGGWGWNCKEIAAYLDDVARHQGVIHRGYVADKHLAVLYNGARALVFPSWYEGFGLPPVEMLACGGAVLASTADALVETVGRHAHLIDPADTDGWRQALVRILTDNDWHSALQQGAPEAVRSFTWERCAAQTWQVYRKAGQSQQPLAA